MLLLQVVLAKHDLMTLVLIAAIGPAKHAGVREADLVFELGAIDRRL